MIRTLFPFDTRQVILDKNVLLHSEPSGATLEQVRATKMLADLARRTKHDDKAPWNLAKVSEEEISQVHELWGESGLLQLLILATSLDSSEFDHFYGYINDSSKLKDVVDGGEKRSIRYDNAELFSDNRLQAFNINVLNPSLSRKLYRSGVHHGSLVYGLGGPRILVSHPFQGIEREVFYDIFANTIDVVTSLNMRGYYGTFHFLDHLPGLDFELCGFPAWALWFSVVAAHSDIVLFVKEYEGEFGESQQLEIAVTPDRIRKKIVEIPYAELSWAKKPDPIESAQKIYYTKQGQVSEDEWNRMEASHAKPFIESYVGGEFPDDRFVVLREDRVDEYPLEFPVYDATADLEPVTSRFFNDTIREDDSKHRSPSAPAWWQFWRR
ncbi:hypothetical protein ACO0LG_04705 [Undibacterium sp. Ji42W]|uniref:hypothetical protein n=1 Tax=Undibacterium sp. Ji42W TaxID=3413039 RepID=UPI003BF110FA